MRLPAAFDGSGRICGRRRQGDRREGRRWYRRLHGGYLSCCGSKLTANIQTSKGEIGSYPVNADATYKWYYKGSDAVLGTSATYTVTKIMHDKILCVDVSVKGYEGTATWEAAAKVEKVITRRICG